MAVTERQYQGEVHEHSRRLMGAWMAELGRAAMTCLQPVLCARSSMPV